MLFRFHPCIYHTSLPRGIRPARVQGPGRGAGLWQPAAVGRGRREAFRQLPARGQDLPLKVFHHGVKSISLRGDEAHRCTDLPEITVPLPVKKGLGCRAHWDWTDTSRALFLIRGCSAELGNNCQG